MILTVEECKKLLQIQNDDYDTLLQDLIPQVQSWITDFCNNTFEIRTDEIYVESDSLTFTHGSNPSISGYDFEESGFTIGMHIKVAGSFSNDGYYQIKEVNETTIMLADDETLKDEESGSDVLITVASFPTGLKLAVAKLIGEDLKNNSVSNGEKVVSESVGNHSINYGGAVMKGEYPEAILRLFKPYKRVKFI